MPACALPLLSAAAPQPLAPATSLQLREQIRRLHRDVRACGAATAKDAPRLGRGSGTPAFAAFCSLRDPVCAPTSRAAPPYWREFLEEEEEEEEEEFFNHCL